MNMHRARTILFPLLCLLALQGAAQTMSLGMVLDSITAHHPALLMADAEIKAMDAEAKGARNWMPTQFGTGFNMTPYDASMWHEGADGMKGMGSYMLSIQQMFPKAGQLNANADYMGRLAAVGREDSVSTFADLRAQAEVSYYAWLVGLKKLEVLRKDKASLQAMVVNAEQSYRDGSSALGAYYKATAAVGEADRMIAVVSAGIDQQRIALNTLMARDPLRVFIIDTTYTIRDYASQPLDTAAFNAGRSDLRAIDRRIGITGAQADLARTDLKPEFGVRYDHMFGFGGSNNMFSLMGMMSVPLPWSTRSAKARVTGFELRGQALLAEKEMKRNELMGAAHQLLAELNAGRVQLDLYTDVIIPGAQRNLSAVRLGYAQQTADLFTYYDAWETVYSAELARLDRLLEVLNAQTRLERVLQINSTKP
ncbi:MAG: TolC family protein [Flavobacteriales bacterium]